MTAYFFPHTGFFNGLFLVLEIAFPGFNNGRNQVGRRRPVRFQAEGDIGCDFLTARKGVFYGFDKAIDKQLAILVYIYTGI